MKNYFCFILAILSLFTLLVGSGLNAQNQSILLPVSGNNTTNPKSGCKFVNFSNPSQPSSLDLPYFPFSYNNGTPGGDPHNEQQLALSDIEIDEYYLGQHPMYGQTVVSDGDGNLLFFIVDNNIYNRYGEVMLEKTYQFPAYLFNSFPGVPGSALFSNYSNVDGSTVSNTRFDYDESGGPGTASPLSALDPEISVFPIGGNCFKYGIVYSFFNEDGRCDATDFFYRTITYIDDEHVEMSDPIALMPHITTSMVCSMASNRGVAVSKFREDYNNTLLFISFVGNVYIFEINSNGDIVFSNTVSYDFQDSDLFASKATEMELIETMQGPQKVYRLAIGLKHNYLNNHYPFIRIAEFNYDNLSLVSGPSDIDITSINAADYENSRIKGIEFSPDANYVYYTCIGQTGLRTLFGGNFLPFHPTIDESYYQYSEIELGRDGNLYYLYSNDEETVGGVSSLSNPNNPSASNFTFDAVSTINKLFFSCDYPTSDKDVNKILLFADQIDGSDYAAYYDNLGLDCCLEHMYYHNWPESSDFDLNPNWIWDAGVANNPFACQTVAYFEHDVIVPSGRTLTVRNMELRFAEGVRLSIEPGAKLILEYSTLGAINKCDDYRTWVGVEIQGQNNQSQVGGSEQGKIIMRNSIIENAENGVFTGLLDEYGYFDVAYSGGIIQAYNSTFRNCERSALFLKYRNFNPTYGQTLNNMSFFRNCEFVLDDYNPYTFAPLDFVKLYGVYNVRFYGCVFHDLRTINIKLIDGINSIDSKFVVDALCLDPISPIPCANMKNSEFSNLYHGIYSVSFNPLNNVTVKNTDFNLNYGGIYINNSKNSIVTNSNFQVGTSNIYGNDYYGLYLENSTGYKVQENEFNSAHYNTYGCVVNNSGTASNLINNNTFNNLRYAIEALNTNGSNGSSMREFGSIQLPFYNGLQFKCNEFDGDVITDIAVTSGIIKKAQGYCSGSPTTPAGNQFATIVPNYGNIATNSGIVPFNYSFHTNAEPLTYSIDVTKIACSQPLNYGTDCAIPVRPNVSQLQNLITLANTTLYNASILIDGGITQTLLDEISAGTNTGTLKNMLIDASPYLSDTVLVATINSPTPLAPGNLKEVLIPNSPLTTEVWAEVEGADLPKGIMKQLGNAQTGISAREQLEVEIAAALDTLSYYENMLLDYYLNDTTSAGLSDLISFYSTQEDVESQKLLVIAAVADNNTALAQTTLALIPQNSLENIAFTDFYSLMIDMADSSRTIESLNPTELSIIQNIANSETSISSNAENILIALGLVEHKELIEKLILPDEYYLDGYLYDNYLCGNNRIEGDTLVLLNQSGDPIEFVTPVVTDANGYFKFDANELAYIDDRASVAIGAIGGFALEGISYHQFGALMDSKPVDLTMVPVNYEWEALYSNQDSMNNVATALDLNENLYVLGYSYSERNGTEIHLLRYDPLGNLVWDTPYTSSHISNIPVNLAADNEGNVFVSIVGQDLDFSAIITVKYDSNGVKLWESGFSENIHDYAVDIETLNDGSCIIAASSDNQILVLKYSSTGTLLWSADYPNAYTTGLQVDAAGSVYVSGLTADTLTNQGALIVNFNPSGQFVWASEQRKSGSISKGGFIMDKNGALILSFTSGNDQINFYKFSNTGQMIWEKTIVYNGIPSYNIVVDSLNNIYGINTNNSSLDIFKWSSNGIEEWTLNIPVDYIFTFLEPAKLIIGNDNTLYFGTTLYKWETSGFMMKLLSEYNIGAITDDGSLLWQVSHKSGNNEITSIADISISSNNNVYATGTTKFEVTDSTGSSFYRNMFSTVKFAQCPMLANLRTMEDNPESNNESNLPESEFVNIYPNPSSGIVYIEYNIIAEESGIFELFTNTGVSVLKLELPTGYQTVSIDKSLLAPGMYHYTAQSDGVDIGNGKLLIVK